MFNNFTETVAALQAFRKRHGDAQRIATGLQQKQTTVDISHYRSVLKNQAIVDEAEKTLRDFKPVTYDVSSHVKAIEAFEAKAVRVLCQEPMCGMWNAYERIQVEKAKETEAKIDEELKDLQATLSNIESARPFDDLTVSLYCHHCNFPTESILRPRMSATRTRALSKPSRP
jgi:F-type H+-transporting ATPase subunit d